MGGCIPTSFYSLLRRPQGSVLSPHLFALYLDDLVDGCSNGCFSFVILYADDFIILNATELHRATASTSCLLKELTWLDMSIHIKKACCLRIGHRFVFKCYPIVTLNGYSLPWVNDFKYLGISITISRTFKCSSYETHLLLFVERYFW